MNQSAVRPSDEDDVSNGATSAAQPPFLPTRHLVPLRPLPSEEAIQHCLRQLAYAIGLGQERLVRIHLKDKQKAPETAGQEEDDDDDDDDGTASSDLLESRFAQAWLTRVISSSSSSNTSIPLSDEIQERAGKVLAALCGNPASVPERTRFLFCPSDSSRAELKADLRVEVLIQDSAITADALGNRTWGAAPLLASRLVSFYALMSGGGGGPTVSSRKTMPKKILELGAGTGLVGLALATLIRGQSHEGVQVDLTDHHPHVLANLQENVDLNFGRDLPPKGRGGEAEDQRVKVKVSRLDWQQVHDSYQPQSLQTREVTYISTAQTLPSFYPSTSTVAPWTHEKAGETQSSTSSRPQYTWPPLFCPSSSRAERQYDVLIACDCIYDLHHPLWIRSVAHRYLSHDSESTLWLISPLRRTHGAEVEAIYNVFPRYEASPGGRSGGGERGGEGGAREEGEQLQLEQHQQQQQQQQQQHESVEAETKAQLRIIWEQDQIGYDNFGPKGGQSGFAAGGAGGGRWAGGEEEGLQSNRGLRTVYRTWAIRWCVR